MNLLHLIQSKIRTALQGLVPDPEPYAAMVKATQDPKHGDYQANCAMSLAKKVGKKPRDVAQEIVDRLELGDELQKPEIAGPGFINLRLQPQWMAKQLQATARDERLGVETVQPPRTFVIDFSSPNVAKPMHVGHLRSTIIGDSLARLLRFLGHTVITDNHLGDWGTQFGIMLFGYKNYLNNKTFKTDPVRELARLYLLIREICKPVDDKKNKAKYAPEARQVAEILAEASRQETAKLHAGDAENLRLWHLFMPYCREQIDRIYKRLDVTFDHFHGESFYNSMLPATVLDLEKTGIAERSKGALVIFSGEGAEPAIIQKQDGAFTYTTSDLATIQYRVKTWKPDVILYVVDFRQTSHFKNLFAAARRWGFDQVALEHISFGSVLGKDGKPLKTREGSATELSRLLDKAKLRAKKIYRQNAKKASTAEEDSPQIQAEEKEKISEIIGDGAIKYADLSQNRTTDYVFNFDKMLAMNGNTATYMQYAYARNRSIFRKGNFDPAPFWTDPPLPIVANDHERALAVQLLRLGETLRAAAEEYQPSLITTYLWDLAKTYSGFFQNCPVLKAETPELRDSPLLLCDLTARVLQRCLDMLGIKTVERM